MVKSILLHNIHPYITISTKSTLKLTVVVIISSFVCPISPISPRFIDVGKIPYYLYTIVFGVSY